MAVELFENEMHLYAIDGDKPAGMGWNRKKESWLPLAPEYAAGLFLDGVKLSAAEAKKMFPKADLKSIPEM